ncbi:PTS ascorbate transporter subunit IIC [Uliginosibacterium gangwonense]|uniref:PTS ascorbate transporter subunit IIC n=1 Tax=Uliginosibacterium gangwonense TaxID=392736 RepID=UPI0003A1840D|nr:PTS ascorbate transporter subunit IIC [Uliginosibacterium gangwonense]
MDFLMSMVIPAWKGLFANIIAEPAIFIGLICLVGYALLSKPWHECFSGFIKATVGFYILQVGSSGLVNAFRPILVGLKDRFQLQAAVLDPYFGFNAVNAAFEKAGWTTSMIMVALLVAFIWNILLVACRRTTKIRTLFITGHIMVQQATTGLWLIFIGVPLLTNNIYGVIACGMLVGTYWAVFSNLTVEATQELTDHAGFAVGHQQMFGVWIAHKFGRKIGNPEKSVEHLKLPGALQIFNDNVVASATLMLIFFGAILLLLGPEYLAKNKFYNPGSGEWFIKYIFKTTLQFAVYLYILSAGVRMFVAEMTESFKGISDKILKGSLPAIDCAATYGFDAAGGNSVLFGFVFGALGQFLAVGLLILFHSPVLIIPGFVPVFFDNATIGVFANRMGGFRALAIMCFASGLIQVLGGAFAAGAFGLAEFGGWHGNFDQDILWPPIGWAMQHFGLIVIPITIIAMLIIPQVQYARNKDVYFKNAEVE